jgi:segregation and condensation protein B
MKNLRDLNERTIRQECHRSGAARRRPPLGRWTNSWRCSTSATARTRRGRAGGASPRCAAEYETRGLELVEVASGYRIQIRAAVAEPVSRLWQERPAKYSRALLETLALVAYRQPITRGEIEQIRGVAVNPNIIKTLLERNWIRVVGHRDVPGQAPELLGTTREFLDYFGLKKLDDLPTLAQLKELEDLRVQLALPGAEPVAGAASVASPAPSRRSTPRSRRATTELAEDRRCRPRRYRCAATRRLSVRWMRRRAAAGLVARSRERVLICRCRRAAAQQSQGAARDRPPRRAQSRIDG